MIANTDGALYNFRKPLIKRLISEGFEVHSISSSITHKPAIFGTFSARLNKVHFLKKI